MKEGSKYFPLFQYLQQNRHDEVVLTFPAIERILGDALPASARKRRGWWSNRSQGATQAVAWMSAGYHVEALDLTAEQVTFRQPTLTYTVRREGDTVLWNSELVKGLRRHLGLTIQE